MIMNIQWSHGFHSEKKYRPLPRSFFCLRKTENRKGYTSAHIIAINIL